MTTTDRTEIRRGIPVDILTPAGMTSTANVISSRVGQAVIVDIRTAFSAGGAQKADEAAAAGLDHIVTPTVAPWSESEDRPALALVVRNLRGGLYVHAAPADDPHGTVGQFGGAYVTGGGAFADMLRAIYGDDRGQVGPIPLHDRRESRG